MVTVTNVDVKKRYLDEWPAGATTTNVDALCTQAETFIQSKSQEVFDLTSAGAVQLSVDLVVNWITTAQYIHAGGVGATGIQPPPIWTKEMESRYQTLLSGTQDQLDTVDSIDLYGD